MASKQEAAAALAARGFKVFPVKAMAKAPPLLKDWPALATTDASNFPPDANIGIHCVGYIVIDVDVKKGGNESFKQLEKEHAGLSATLTTITPTGGRHLFYRLPEGHPGVPNSVGELGNGLDVRSKNGYVIAPGSEVKAGRYRFAADKPVANAPEWLVQKLGASTTRVRTEAVNTPDAPEAIVQRAADWLAQQPGAVEEEGGDACTYQVAVGLRDLGVSKAQAVDLMLTLWNDRCAPPWTPNEIGIKASNAYNYGQNEPGAKVALPSDFPITPNLGTIIPKTSTKAVRLSDFANSESKGPGYLVKGLLQRRSYAVAYGAPGEGKTFIALDIAYHVAAGLPWMDRKTHGGVVLYLAYEGTGGMVKRAQALRQKYGAEDVPLYIASAAFNLREQAGRQALAGILAGLSEKPLLVVIDTLARALTGGDENSAQDVGAFNSAIAALIESTGACVLLIHHSGKNKSAGARGSSALLGAIDTELEVDQGRVTAWKQRDIEMGDPVGFKLKPVMVGLDEDGDELTSCVVEADTVSKDSPHGRIAGNAKRGFDLLCELRPTNDPITEVEWREGCSAFITKGLAQRFYDIKKVLLQKKYIVIDDAGMITRRCE